MAFFMFEEICRKTGTIRIPTGEYSDSVPGKAKQKHPPAVFSTGGEIQFIPFWGT